MSIITLPPVPRPQPLRPAPRTSNMSGESSLATAQSNAAAAAMNLGAAFADLVATKGQAEYNEALAKYKTAEMEKIAELEATPIEVLDAENTGTSHDEISRQTIMKALPNTNALREWRNNYLNNELLPTMKSKRAKQALKIKAGQDAVKTDGQFIQFDYSRNKARLADSYGEKANVYMASGDRNEFRATILEAQKIGVYNAQEADDILDSGFALMHQNDVINAAMQASFSRDGYGNEKIGKEIVSKSLSFESYDGSEKTLNDKEVMKLFDDKFKDQRQSFVNTMNEQFAQAEDEAMQRFLSGDLSNEWVESTFQDIPGTTGRSQQRYWIGQAQALQEGSSGKGSVMIPEVLELLNNKYMDKSIKQEELYKIAAKYPDEFTPERLKDLTTLINDSQNRLDYRVQTGLTALSDAGERLEKIKKKNPEEGAKQQGMLDSIGNSYLRAVSAANNERDVVKRDKMIQQANDDLIKFTNDFKLLDLLTGTPQEVGGKVIISESGRDGYKIEYDRDLKKMKDTYSGIVATTPEGQNYRAQVFKYEGEILKQQFPNLNDWEIKRYVGDDRKFVHSIPARNIDAANLKTERGYAIVKFAEDDKGNTVLQYLTNSGNFQTYELKPNRSRIERNRESIEETQSVYDKLYGGF